MEDNSTTPIEMRLSEVPGMPSPDMELSYVTAIPMNGATFTENQEVRIGLNVPTDCFVDLKRAYLKFKVNNTSAHAVYLDPLVGGAAVIDNWRVIGGTGALLEEVIHYNTMYAAMNANKNIDVVSTVNHISEGAAKRPGKAEPIDGNGTADLTGVGLTQLTNAESRVITHRPQSAFFNADRYMPLGYSQGLTYVSITLAQNATPFMKQSGATTTTTYSCSEWELHLPILKPGPEFANMFRSAMSSGVPIQIHSVGIQNTQQAIPGSTTGENTLTFSTRKRSVKSLVNALRLNSTITNEKLNSVSGFANCDISEYNYSVGGMRIPAQRIKVQTAVDGKDAGELLANQQLALGHYSSDLRGICAIDARHNADPVETYLITDEVATDEGGKALFSLDLESYNAAFAGKNLAGQGLPLIFHAQTGSKGIQATGAVLCDLYVIHDVVYVLDGVTGTFTANS